MNQSVRDGGDYSTQRPIYLSGGKYSHGCQPECDHYRGENRNQTDACHMSSLCGACQHIHYGSTKSSPSPDSSGGYPPFWILPPRAAIINLMSSSVTFGSSPSVWPLSIRITSATTLPSLQPL
jgi:hypothetical protein